MNIANEICHRSPQRRFSYEIPFLALPNSVILSLFCVLIIAPPTFAATRVALVTTGDVEPSGPTIALVTAELSGVRDVQLVDRESIHAVLQEQKLSLSGVIEADRAIQLGKLLKVDVFAVVDADGKGGQPFGLTIFDANTGLRLWDAAIHGKPAELGKTIAVAVRAAVEKDRTLDHGLRLIGFLPVRNVDLPRDRDVFCDMVRLLVERQLTSSPAIAVLERTRLVEVNQERQLPTTQPGSELWASVAVVQLEIGHGPSGHGLRAAVTLSGNSGPMGKRNVDVDLDSAADLAEKIQRVLVDLLKVPPAHPLHRDDEADRFARDAIILMHHSRFTAATEAAEAAFALQPEHGQRLILSNALWMRSSDRLRDGADMDQSLTMASRALALQQQSLKIRLEKPYDDGSYLDYMGGEERITFIEHFSAGLNSARSEKPEVREKAKEFRRAAMNYLLDYFDGWGRHVLKHHSNLDHFDAEILYGVRAAASVAVSFKEFAAARDHLCHQWIGSFNEAWPHAENRWMEAGGRQSQFMRCLFGMEYIFSASRWNDYTPAGLHASLGMIAGDFSQSTCKVMRMYGTIAGALADPNGAASSAEDRDKVLEALMHQLDETLDKPGPTPLQTARYAYMAAVDGINLLPAGTESSTNAAIALLRRSVARKDVIPYETVKLLLNEVSVGPNADRDRSAWLETLERVVSISREPNCHVFDANADGVRQVLAEVIRNVRKAHPELGPEKIGRPWTSVKLLATVGPSLGVTRLEEYAQVAGDRVCFIGSGVDADGRFFIQGFDVALTGGAPKPLAKMFVTPLDKMSDKNLFRDMANSRLIHGGAVDDRNYYVSVRSQGVVIFPRDGSDASRINIARGLPSDWTQFLASMGGDLYITSTTAGGSYLIKWNLEKQAATVRVSSIRKDAKSPLDNTRGLQFESMTADPPRNQILLGARESGSGGNWDQIRAGLWRYDVAADKFKKVLTVGSALNVGLFRGIDQDSLFMATTLWVVQYDLKTNSAQYASFKLGTINESYIRELQIKKETMKGAGWAEPDTQRPGARRVINNWLWMGEPFSRISSDAKTVEPLDAQLASDCKPIGPVWTIEWASRNQLLLGDIRQLYVVGLK
jgi:hypothetical protein